METNQLITLSFSIIISLIIGIFLGYRFGKNKMKHEYIKDKSLQLEEQVDESNPIDVQDKSLKTQLITKMEQLQQQTKTDFVGLAIYDVMTDEIRWRIAIGATNQRYKRIVIRMGKGIAGEVVQLNRPIKVNNFPMDVIGDPIEYPILLIEHLRSVLAVPVSFQQKIYGVILLGQREERNFTEIEEREALTVSHEIAKELERANVYKRIKSENEDSDSKSLDLDIYKHNLIQYLVRKQKEAKEKNKGKIDFEVLDQSIIEISTELQGILINAFEQVFSSFSSLEDNQIEISIGREGNHLLVECKSNSSINTKKETFNDLYHSIGGIGGSIQSYRENNSFNLVIQVPVSSFKNPV